VSPPVLTEQTEVSRASIAEQVHAFYSQPVGWWALIVTSAILTYAGNSVMFWFHAIYRGEQGPPINDVLHWLLDSTLAFVTLTPVLFFLLPGALYALRRSESRGSGRKAAAFVVLVGVIFGVVTGPGPLLHDRLVGQYAPVGRLVGRVLPHDPAVMARNAKAGEHSALSEGLLQVVVGVPVYVVAGLVALSVLRVLNRTSAGAPR
jgi:hypothetical protein